MLHDERWDLDEDGKVIWSVADYIDEHGWIQNRYGDISGKGPVCILGAYRAVYGTECHSSMPRLSNFLGGKLHSISARTVANWNDVEGRTKEEVITMLKQAAKTRGE